MKEVNRLIKLYPGNATKKNKTINNWRTEISSLFGLIEYNQDLTECRPSKMSCFLSEKQDLVEFFKYFLYYFQYPGGHLKTHETVKLINAGVRFKPAKYILSLLKTAEKEYGGRFGLKKEEVTHCIFNDLRVTRDGRPVKETLDIIMENRNTGKKYDSRGDTVRYAKDILDYMYIANLLTLHGDKYYLNLKEIEAIGAFIEKDIYFGDYDFLYGARDINARDITSLQSKWFDYVNRELNIEIFSTNLFKYLNINEENYKSLELLSLEDFHSKLEEGQTVKTKDIGDFGENLIHGHECRRIKLGGREDLIHLIKKIPNIFCVGYDIQSVELNEKKRYVEVKTTISSEELKFKMFHLTSNEWNSAETLQDAYFVYRLMVSKYKKKLFIIQNPVGKYKSNLVSMIPRNDGADIYFSDRSGVTEELLIWQS